MWKQCICIKIACERTDIVEYLTQSKTCRSKVTILTAKIQLFKITWPNYPKLTIFQKLKKSITVSDMYWPTSVMHGWKNIDKVNILTLSYTMFEVRVRIKPRSQNWHHKHFYFNFTGSFSMEICFRSQFYRYLITSEDILDCPRNCIKIFIWQLDNNFHRSNKKL